ncbi:hypothetical protein E2562_010135 [Oryza meyeriana var. granulata]|uniref:DUF834 domain-containing protein n=1 Tax=Oryza meyeriana var. granulata TaxID=110450 RepID=A0A6G1EI65_9ORYZ|nr:hypothetical protein E2562_010135 [Oryza meyeriana var. granulata]
MSSHCRRRHSTWLHFPPFLQHLRLLPSWRRALGFGSAATALPWRRTRLRCGDGEPGRHAGMARDDQVHLRGGGGRERAVTVVAMASAPCGGGGGVDADAALRATVTAWVPREMAAEVAASAALGTDVAELGKSGSTVSPA